MDTLKSDYSSKDLGEACALMVAGQPIRAIHWKDAIAYFVFADRAACEALGQRY